MAGDGLELIPEADAFRLATPLLAFAAVREALAAAAAGRAWSNPVLIAPGLGDGESFSIKSGAARGDRLVGAKIGSFWPGAPQHGRPRHSSLVVLLDADTGRARTVVEAGAMNGRRTAAANAVATDLLARADSRTLSVIGAGAQARYEIEALLRVRNFERIMIASRTSEAAQALARRLTDDGLAAEATDIAVACRAADVLVTATPGRAALFDADLIAPGVHISAMGADQAGKQELPPALLRRARLFADWPQQSLMIGEFQSVRGEAQSGAIAITAIGEVISGREPGREDPAEITVFDSSGLALQDLFVAAAVREAWRAEAAA